MKKKLFRKTNKEINKIKTNERIEKTFLLLKTKTDQTFLTGEKYKK